jgi:exopolysaccharide production protein ExoQ
MIVSWRRGEARTVVFLLFACLCLFAFGHDLRYSSEFQSIQDDSGASVAQLVEAGSWVRRLALFALASGSLMSLYANRSSSNSKSMAVNTRYFLFLLLALLSVCWADDPSLTLRRSVEFLFMSTAAFALAKLLNLAGLLKFSWISSFAFVAIGVFAEIALNNFHPTSYDYRFCGTLHPNHQAWQCGLLVLSSCALVRRPGTQHRFVYVFSGLFGFTFLLLTKSRTTLGALLVALIVLFGLGMSRVQRARSVGFVSLLLVGAFATSLLWQSAFAELYKSQLAGRGSNSVTTLTGRLPLWSMALDFVARRPVTGYGFYSFWTPDHIQYFSDKLNWGVPESHNGYIELLLSLGVVGLGLYMLLIGTAVMRYRRLACTMPLASTVFPVALFTFFLIVMFCDVIALNIDLVTTIVFAYVWKASARLGTAEDIGLSEWLPA